MKEVNEMTYSSYYDRSYWYEEQQKYDTKVKKGSPKLQKINKHRRGCWR